MPVSYNLCSENGWRKHIHFWAKYSTCRLKEIHLEILLASHDQVINLAVQHISIDDLFIPNFIIQRNFTGWEKDNISFYYAVTPIANHSPFIHSTSTWNRPKLLLFLLFYSFHENRTDRFDKISFYSAHKLDSATV